MKLNFPSRSQFLTQITGFTCIITDAADTDDDDTDASLPHRIGCAHTSHCPACLTSLCPICSSPSTFQQQKSTGAVQFQIHFNTLVNYIGWWGKWDTDDSPSLFMQTVTWTLLCSSTRSCSLVDCCWWESNCSVETPILKRSSRLQFSDHANITETEFCWVIQGRFHITC